MPLQSSKVSKIAIAGHRTARPAPEFPADMFPESAFSVTAASDGVIRSMKVEETDGITNAFVFADEKPDVAAPDAEFVFNAPTGVKVVEGLPPV